MSKIEDGGPAFPAEAFAAQHAPGMSLRDWFAGQALGGLIQGYMVITEDEPDRRSISLLSYAWADVMIAARSKEPQS